MDIDLSSVQAKLRRADEHIEALQREITAFMELDGHGIVTEPNADSTEYVVRAHFAVIPNTMQWALIFGDIVHCLRSALDHMVYAIAVHESNADPPPNERKIMMPLKTTTDGFAANAYRIKVLSQEVRTRIEALQPYPGSHNEALGLLDDLDIRDKHRVLPVALLRPASGHVPISGLTPGAQCIIDFSTNTLEHNAPVMTLTLDRPTPGVQVQTSLGVTVVVREGTSTPARWHIITALGEALRHETERAIDVVLDRPSRLTGPSTSTLLPGYELTVTPG